MRKAFACGVLLVAALLFAPPLTAHAGLKIRLEFMESLPPSATDMIGSGDLEEIMQVAAEAWEEVFKGGSGNWEVTIEFGWAPVGLNWAREFFIAQGGNNPVRMT